MARRTSAHGTKRCSCGTKERCDCVLFIQGTDAGEEWHVKVTQSGMVVYGGAYTPDKAAKALWEAVANPKNWECV